MLIRPFQKLLIFHNLPILNLAPKSFGAAPKISEMSQGCSKMIKIVERGWKGNDYPVFSGNFSQFLRWFPDFS